MIFAYVSAAWRSSHAKSVGPTLKESRWKLLTMVRMRFSPSTRRAVVFGP
jgi:hypothetical protein